MGLFCDQSKRELSKGLFNIHNRNCGCTSYKEDKDSVGLHLKKSYFPLSFGMAMLRAQSVNTVSRQADIITHIKHYYHTITVNKGVLC